MRIGLLAAMLALASNVAVVGFIHWRTHSQLLDALEDSLPIAVALAVLLGLACGGIVARYVGGRVRSIATVADRVTAGDFAQRVRPSQSRDAFDRLGEQLNEMLDRIGSLMGELRMVTDSLAHDLRSPVSRLRSAAHSAAETSDPAERDRQLTSVVRQADSLMRILTTVLEISRSEALTSRSQFSAFDVGELSAELSEMYEPVAEEAGAALLFQRPDRPIELFGHRQLIAQAVSNLVENAVRYGASGEAIEVTVGSDGRLMSIAVADHGPGIPADRRAEAVRRFGRLDSSRSQEGAGLGLALVRAIAHLHGGELVLEDNRPGLVAVLQLPLRPAHRSESVIHPPHS
ncbi:MAG TPA: ATP-binding protein [Sphingomicrobium sp.]